MKHLATLLLLAACAADPALDAESDLAAVIGPQSLSHGTLSAAHPETSFSFHGIAGDVVAPDVWPTGSSALTPTLTLEGPRSASGRRATLASGSPRGEDARHVAIDGFLLPQTGTYLLTVGTAPGERHGKFTLRMWMQSSHLPRQEGSQVDLSLTPSMAVVAVLQDHARSPHPWTDAEIDGLVTDLRQQRNARIAFSSAQNLLSALATSTDACTDAQRARALAGVAQLVGSPARFRALDPQTQAFALWWLGGADGLFFKNAPMPLPANALEIVTQLIKAWPGAIEDASQRRVQAKVFGGAVYGWTVEWSASVVDVDGTMAWIDFAQEWFDSKGEWVGELSAGASEPDDDW
jgi:hypothetical protein